MDDEEYDDEMGVAASFVMAFAIAAVSTTIVAAAVAWNAVALVAEAWRRVTR